jgi:hypothetical protein
VQRAPGNGVKAWSWLGKWVPTELVPDDVAKAALDLPRVRTRKAETART